MNRDQKAAAIDEIAAEIQEADAIFAVDYRGISVPQAAELRTQAARRRRDLPDRQEHADRARRRQGRRRRAQGAAGRPDRADVRARRRRRWRPRRSRDYARATETARLQGRLHGRRAADADEISSIARLPSREVLYGQLVGIVASPITGLARGLGALLGGLADRARPGPGEEGVRRDPGRRRAGCAPRSPPPRPRQPAAEAEAPAAEPEAEAPAEEPDRANH